MSRCGLDLYNKTSNLVIMFPSLHLGKSEQREAKLTSEGHEVATWSSRNLNPGPFVVVFSVDCSLRTVPCLCRGVGCFVVSSETLREGSLAEAWKCSWTGRCRLWAVLWLRTAGLEFVTSFRFIHLLVSDRQENVTEEKPALCLCHAQKQTKNHSPVHLFILFPIITIL